MSKKGCDASNIYDEELSDKEYSDDEAEKAAKRAKKLKKNNKKIEADLEDGEINDPNEQKRFDKKRNFNKGGYSNDNSKRPRQD